MLCVIMYCVLLCVMLFYCCYCLCVIMYCMLLCVVLFYYCHCLCVVVVMCLYLLLYVVDDVLLVVCLLWRVRDWCACLMKGLSYQMYPKIFCRLMGAIFWEIYIFFFEYWLCSTIPTPKVFWFLFIGKSNFSHIPAISVKKYAGLYLHIISI